MMANQVFTVQPLLCLITLPQRSRSFSFQVEPFWFQLGSNEWCCVSVKSFILLMTSFSGIIMGIVNDYYSDFLFKMRLKRVCVSHSPHCFRCCHLLCHTLYGTFVWYRPTGSLLRPFDSDKALQNQTVFGGFSWLWSNGEAMPLGCPEKNIKNGWTLGLGVWWRFFFPLQPIC